MGGCQKEGQPSNLTRSQEGLVADQYPGCTFFACTSSLPASISGTPCVFTVAMQRRQCKSAMHAEGLSLPLQAKRAAGLLAAAQHAAADGVRPAKRQRQRCLRAYVGPPEHILLGARISVYWPDDDAFYKVWFSLAFLSRQPFTRLRKCKEANSTAHAHFKIPGLPDPAGQALQVSASAGQPRRLRLFVEEQGLFSHLEGGEVPPAGAHCGGAWGG